MNTSGLYAFSTGSNGQAPNVFVKLVYFVTFSQRDELDTS